VLPDNPARARPFVYFRVSSDGSGLVGQDMNPKKWKPGHRIAAASTMSLVILAAFATAFDPLLRIANGYWPQSHGLRLIVDAIMGAFVSLALPGIARHFRTNNMTGPSRA
jgi:hypothetical protein